MGPRDFSDAACEAVASRQARGSDQGGMRSRSTQAMGPWAMGIPRKTKEGIQALEGKASLLSVFGLGAACSAASCKDRAFKGSMRTNLRVGLSQRPCCRNLQRWELSPRQDWMGSTSTRDPCGLMTPLLRTGTLHQQMDPSDHTRHCTCAGRELAIIFVCSWVRLTCHFAASGSNGHSWRSDCVFARGATAEFSDVWCQIIYHHDTCK